MASKLKFNFTSEEPVTLTRSDQNLTGETLIADKLSMLLRTDSRTLIYRASHNGRDIILKLRFGKDDIEDLVEKDKAYLRLPGREELEGKVIPAYLGFYSGKDKGQREIGCIVMEDCGENIGTTAKLPLEVQEKLCGLLKTLHDFGLHHVNFSTNKVFERDGKYRIIDHDSLKQHECEWDGNWHIGEEIPFIGELKCRNLRVTGKKLGIWKPFYGKSVMINGEDYMNEKDIFPTQRVVNALLLDVPINSSTKMDKYVDWLMKAKDKGVDSNESIAAYRKSAPVP
ncbi:hypothetical protein DFH11DRAFT_1546666 [Phellopilus nigrolimitatus]|nr:hypothetical protein DFH11DRAFT_1546666 [Phellopilus nigrolimitatus]